MTDDEFFDDEWEAYHDLMDGLTDEEQAEYIGEGTPYRDHKHGKYVQIPTDKVKVLNRMSRGSFVNSSNPYLEMTYVYRLFGADPRKYDELCELFPVFRDVKKWRTMLLYCDKIMIAKPNLIWFTTSEIEALNKVNVTERQRKLLKGIIGLMKSRNWTELYRFPKWRPFCRALGVEPGRWLPEFERVMVKSGLFERVDNWQEDNPERMCIYKYVVEPEGEICELYKDIFEIFGNR